MNESIDGEPFTFNEGKAQFRFGSAHKEAATDGKLPREGILEFDYVVLRPREGLPLPSRLSASTWPTPPTAPSPPA